MGASLSAGLPSAEFCSKGRGGIAAHVLSRRHLGRWAAASLAAVALGGCDKQSPSQGRLEKVWGEVGLGNGRFSKPRAIAIDKNDELYIVDMTARIQVFDTDGRFLRGWETPVHAAGKPTGLTIDQEGNLLVADTHYFRILTYTPAGELLADRTIGGTLGQGQGEFGFVTDCVRDAAGNYYVSEYGEWDRIQKFSPACAFILQWGGHGSEPGRFLRPQHLEFDAHEQLWVADACNHRIQVFDKQGKLLAKWGESGSQPGQLYYPYCLILDGRGHVFVVEYGNNRVQKLTLEGRSLAIWGREGRGPGELFNPWAMVLDSQGRMHVLDSNNHRVQRVVL